MTVLENDRREFNQIVGHDAFKPSEIIGIVSDADAVGGCASGVYRRCLSGKAEQPEMVCVL